MDKGNRKKRFHTFMLLVLVFSMFLAILPQGNCAPPMDVYTQTYTEFNKSEGNAAHHNVTLMEDGSHDWYGYVYFNLTGTTSLGNPPQVYLCDHATDYESGNSVIRAAMNTTWLGVYIIANGTDLVASDYTTFSAKSSPNSIGVRFANYNNTVSIIAYDNGETIAYVSYSSANYQNITYFGGNCGGSGPYTDGNVYLSFVYSAEEYKYQFYGVYDETTGLLEESDCNITVYFDEEDVPNHEFSFNTSYIYSPGIPVRYFHFELGDNDREYWVEPTETNTTIYVFNDTLTDYTINFMDLCGALEDSPYVNAQFYINGTLMTVDKRKADQQSSVSMSLVNKRKYVISLSGSNSTYVWGDLLMTDSTSIQLVLRGVDFPQSSLLAEGLAYYAIRSSDGETITVYYLDGTEDTVSVNITIYEIDLTVAYNITFSNSSFTLAWSSATNTTDYLVVAEISHSDYGELTSKKFLVGIIDGSVSWSLDFLGDWDTWSFNSYTLIPSLLILCVAGSFSKLNAYVGAILMVVMATFLSAMGWFPLAGGILVVGFALAILMALIYTRSGVPV